MLRRLVALRNVPALASSATSRLETCSARSGGACTLVCVRTSHAPCPPRSEHVRSPAVAAAKAATVCRVIASSGLRSRSVTLQQCRGMTSSITEQETSNQPVRSTDDPGPTARKLTPEEGVLSLRMAVETLESPDLEDALPNFPVDIGEQVPSDLRRLFSLVNSWQKALSLAQTVQMEAISRFGIPATAGGLLDYEQQLVKFMSVPAGKQSGVGDELGKLKRRKWQAILRRCFSLECEFEPLHLTEATAITRRIADAVQCDTFRAGLLGKLDRLGLAATQSDRRALVVEQLLVSHAAVLATQGYGGEGGYVRFQAAITEHVVDPTVAENIAAASSSVLKLADVKSTR